ncbi:MAG TPA: EAL domain-containing protein, partial [Burkholderiales bacterium]|nr:EAL domain-containing protein [Burkholderiales bacterium]
MANPASDNDGQPDERDASRDDPAPADGGQSLYLSFMGKRLLGEDPRAMLEQALHHDQFLLLAQKIVAVKSGVAEPQCYEVLLRLRQEEENLLPPGGFLDLAVSLGMMEALDRWVLRALMAWGEARLKARPSERLPMMCVNISSAALESPEFAQLVSSELNRTRYPRRALCFELDEQDLIERPAAVHRFAAAVKPDCRIMVDNFGGVRVSFSHLAGLAVDFLKIDGSIVQNMHRDPTELIKAWAINLACQKVGLRTVAKFVET